MITHDLATAQILFIAASDSRPQLHELTGDLQRSRYRYCVVVLGDKAGLVDAVQRQIDVNAGRVPVVLLVNYRFAGKDGQKLLELAQRARRVSAIECIVTHPPMLQSRRQALLTLGARLFDGQDGIGIRELTLH